MSERYEFIDMNETGPRAVRTAFANQVAYCRDNDAPITARIVAALATLLDKPATEFARRIAAWEGAPLADALPLRAAGGLHALHLGGVAPDLAPIYADAEDINDAAIVGAVVAHHEASLLPWLDGPPQTNEAGRSSNFIAAMLWLAWRLWRVSGMRPGARALLLLAAWQFASGLSNVVLDWPLLAAVGHTGGAAALVIVLTGALAGTRSARPLGATAPASSSLPLSMPIR